METQPVGPAALPSLPNVTNPPALILAKGCHQAEEETGQRAKICPLWAFVLRLKTPEMKHLRAPVSAEVQESPPRAKIMKSETQTGQIQESERSSLCSSLQPVGWQLR